MKEGVVSCTKQRDLSEDVILAEEFQVRPHGRNSIPIFIAISGVPICQCAALFLYGTRSMRWRCTIVSYWSLRTRFVVHAQMQQHITWLIASIFWMQLRMRRVAYVVAFLVMCSVMMTIWRSALLFGFIPNWLRLKVLWHWTPPLGNLICRVSLGKLRIWCRIVGSISRGEQWIGIQNAQIAAAWGDIHGMHGRNFLWIRALVHHRIEKWRIMMLQVMLLLQLESSHVVVGCCIDILH